MAWPGKSSNFDRIYLMLVMLITGDHRQQRLKGDIETQKPSPGSRSKAYYFAIKPLMHNIPKWSDTL